MNGKEARKLRKMQQIEMRQLVHHTMEIKAYTNGLRFRKRAAIAIAILFGRW